MDARDVLDDKDRQAWTLAALATAFRGSDPARADAARRVLEAQGIETESGELPPPLIAALAESTLRQAALAAAAQPPAWADMPDEVLIRQGEVSGFAGPGFARDGLSQLDGMAERLSAPGAAMLDVGTGIGALAAGFARVFPALHVTGIDVSPRVLALGERWLEEHGVERVQLRLQDVTDLPDEDAFDLVWVPAPFLPETALRAGLRRCLRALRPGGCLMLGHHRTTDDPADDALNAFKLHTYGGTMLTEPQAAALLSELGYAEVATMSVLRRAPGVTVGRRPQE